MWGTEATGGRTEGGGFVLFLFFFFSFLFRYSYTDMLTSHNYTERFFFFYNYYKDLKISFKKRTRMRREPIRPERHPGGSGACKREAMVVKKEIFRGDRCTLGLGDPTQGGGRGARKQADLTVK